MSLTLVYVNIKQWTDGFMTKLCFGDGDVFVDLSLLNILASYNYLIISIYNELGLLVTEENILLKFTITYKIYKIIKN